MNNNNETVRQWIREQLEIVEEDGGCKAILLNIVAAGDEKEIYSMKQGAPKWGNAIEMADLFWTQAQRTAKGLPGFCQFQLEAVFGGNDKATRFLPFGIAGATQLGPAAGGTAFGGMATEAPTPHGQMGQGMRLTEMLVQGAFQLLIHTTNVLQRENESKTNQIEKLHQNNADLWKALKDALLEIQNSAMSQAMKALQMEAVKKLITLAPGLINMMTGRDVFPASAVDSSLVETIGANLTGEEQSAVIAWLNSNPNGQPVAAVLSDQLSKYKKRKEAEAEELRRATNGLPPRTYNEALNDAGGNIIRVLKGEEEQPKELPEGEKKVQAAVKQVLDAEVEPVTPAAKPSSAPAAKSVDTDIVEELLRKTDRAQIQMLGGMLGEELKTKLLKRLDELEGGS